MKPLKTQSGFTLLELILALVIVGFIIGWSLGGIRLGISIRETGGKKVETFQRLRVITEQLAQTIKSNYPVFFVKDEVDFSALGSQKDPGRILAFEGREDSIRLVTFASPLALAANTPWAHEVRFYLGKHPDTGESGILMMERDMANGEMFPKNPERIRGARHILLAREVAEMKFRYYLVEEMSDEERKLQEDPTLKYKGHWVTTVLYDSESSSTSFPSSQEASAGAMNQKKFSLPRAVEISIGLIEPAAEGTEEEPRIVYSPSRIILLHTGIEFVMPEKPKENEPT